MSDSWFWIGLGGAIGAIARVGIVRIFPPFLLSFPIKIFFVNMLGCFLIGVFTEVMALYGNTSINMRHFFIQGLLGGFTTFSAFALEFGLLFQKGSQLLAIFYAFLSVSLSIVSFFGGLKVIKIFA